MLYKKIIYICFELAQLKVLFCCIAQQAFEISRTEPLGPVEKVGSKAVCNILQLELNISESFAKVVWKWLNLMLVFLSDIQESG